jgi:hypothetical protein
MESSIIFTLYFPGEDYPFSRTATFFHADRGVHIPGLRRWPDLSFLSGYNIHTAVNVQCLAGEVTRERGREKGTGIPHIHDVDKLAERRARCCLVNQKVEVLEA